MAKVLKRLHLYKLFDTNNVIIYHFGHGVNAHIRCFDAVEIGRICQFSVAYLYVHFVINACANDIAEQGGSAFHQHGMYITRGKVAENMLPVGAVTINDGLGIG